MQSQTTGPAPVFKSTNLTIARGGRAIFESLDIELHEGITAILGPNGAGKTTLFEGLLNSRSEGRAVVELDGVEVTPKSRQAFYSRVGYMPQHWQFQPGFSVRESVKYAAWLKGVPSRRIGELAERALTNVDLVGSGSRRVGALSGGTRQRVGLAEAFVHDPRVVLLDEPTVGLDPSQRAAFREFLLRSSPGRAIALSTHLTDDVEAIANRVLIILDGRIGFDGTVTELGRRGESNSSSGSNVEAGYLSIVNSV